MSRKCILILLCFTSGVISGFAQVQLEIFAGITSGKIREKISANNTLPREAFKSLIRFPAIGIIGDIGLSEYWRLESGFVLSPRGTKLGNDVIRLDYIDVPLIFIIQPKNFRVFFGPQISFLGNARTGNLVITDAFEKSELGMRYGVGFEKEEFAARLAIQSGLQDMFKHPELKWKSTSVTLSFGYLLKKFDRSRYTPENPLKDFRRTN